MVYKVREFIHGFKEGMDNVSKAVLGCFSTRNCPEKKDERYQIAESISTESKYFHDFQAIADQFRFLDKTKGTIPKLHCPEEEAERYQESNPCESNYDHGLKTNADQDLSIDLEIKGTNPKLHCPEEEAERYQRSNPCESNYGHGVKNNADQDLSIDLEIKGTSPKLHFPEEEAERYQESNPCESNYGHDLKTNADQDLSIDLEIKGTSPKLQLQCPKEERYEDPKFDRKGKGNNYGVLDLYYIGTQKLHHLGEEDAEQLKRKTECKEEMTLLKEMEVKFKNKGSDEIQNCPVSSSKQEMVIIKPLRGENALNEETGVTKQLKGKKEGKCKKQMTVLNEVKEKIKDNDADETMKYNDKSCFNETTREKQFEGKNEKNEDMSKAKEEEEENECNGEMDGATQIKDGRKTNTCCDIDNGKVTKVQQTKCKNKCNEEMTVAKHLVGRKNGMNEMSFGNLERENTESNVNEIENCNSESYKNNEGGKQINEKSESTDKTAVSRTEDKNEEKLANEIQIPISICYNANYLEAKKLNRKNECNEQISVAKQENIREMNIADDMKYCHSTSYNKQSVESNQMDGKIECDEGKITAKLENKMADAWNTFHGTCSKEEMAVENQLKEKNKCNEENASHGGNEMDVAKKFKEKRKEKIAEVKENKGINKCNNEFEVADQVREKIKNKDDDEIMNCHSTSFDEESSNLEALMQMKKKMEWNEENQFGRKNECTKEVAICKQMDEVSECREDMNIAKQGKNESKGETKENDKCYEEMTVPQNIEGKIEQPSPEEILVSKQVEEENGEKVTVKTKRRTNEDNGTQSVTKLLGEKNEGKKAFETKRSCFEFNEGKSTAAAVKTKEKKDVNVFNTCTNENDCAETTKEPKGKKENTFVAKRLNLKKDDQVEDVMKRNDAQNKRMALEKHIESKNSFDFGQWLKFFSVLAKPFPFLFILVCLAGGAIASGDGYLKTEEVLNASDPFIGPDRCNIESDKLQCNHQEIKACIPDINGSMWVVCTGNFPLTGYACPVVTKTSKDNHWIVQSIDNKCNNCSYSETIKERLHRENNTVGEECLRSYAVYPSKMNATNYEDDGLVLKIIAITISVIVAIIIAIGIGCWCFKYRRGRNNQQNGNNVNPVNKEHNRGDGMELQTLNRGAGSEPLTQNGGAGSEPLTQNGGAGSEHLTQNGGAGSEHLTQNKEEERERLMQNGERGC